EPNHGDEVPMDQGGGDQLSAPGVPQTTRPLLVRLPPSGEERVAVRTEGDAPDPLLVGYIKLPALLSRHRPEPSTPLRAPRQKARAIGGNRHAVHRSGMQQRRTDRLLRGHRPQARTFVVAGSDNEAAVGANGHGIDKREMASLEVKGFPSGSAPQT